MDKKELINVFPLSDMQESYLAGKCMGEADEVVGCHIYCEIEEEKLDCHRLNEAWNRLIALHEMLRDKIEEDGRQYFKKADTYQIRIFDVTDKDIKEAEAQILALRGRMSHKVYQSDDYPLYEICVTYHQHAKSTIHFSMDEWIADAASISLLFKQWYQLYRYPESKIDKIDFTFKDFMEFQDAQKDSRKYQADYQYWMEKLQNINKEVPWFFKKPVVGSRSRKRYLHVIENSDWNRIKQLSAQNKVSATAVVLTCFIYTLRKYKIKNHTPLILTYFNRLPIHNNIDQVVGPFITTMIFLMKEKHVSDVRNHCFWEEVKQTQNQLWDDNDHNLISGVKILRELKRKRIVRNDFTIPMVFTSVIHNMGIDDQDVESWYDKISFNITQTPQVYLDHQVFESKDGLEIHWDVLEDAFELDYIEQMFQFYGMLLTQVSNLPKVLCIDQSGNTEFGLTPLQRSYVLSQMLEPDDTIQRVIYQEFLIENDSIQRIRDAWTNLVMNTPGLRIIVTGEQTLKMIETDTVPISVLDLRNWTAVEQEREIERNRKEMEDTLFPLDTWPKFDLRILWLTESKIQVSLSADPLIVEGKSLALIYKRLFTKGNAATEEQVSFGDYITAMEIYLKTEDVKEDKNYWKKKFEHIPHGPFEELVTEYIRHPAAGKKRHIRRLSAKLDGYNRLKEYGNNLGCTIDSVLLTIYMNVLRKAAGNKEFTIVNVSWERIFTIPSVEDTIGEFTTMSWITSPAEDISFEEQVKYIDEAIKNDISHKQVSGLDLIGKKRPIPVLPVIFTSTAHNWEIPDHITYGKGLSITPHVYLDNISFIEHNSLQINWDYDSDVFSELAIETFFNDYRENIQALCSSEKETAGLIWEKVTQQSLLHPDKTAVKCGERIITYRELDKRSSQIAGILIKQGVRPETLVGICMEKSIEMIVTIISILKAGGAYVPLDPSYPQKRLAYIMEDSQMKLIVTTYKSCEKIAESKVPMLYFDLFDHMVSGTVEPEFSVDRQSGGQAAYVIYTSGSTGNPKGVVVTHTNVRRLFSQTEHWFEFRDSDIWTMYHSFAFDFSVWEIWGALFYGGTLLIVPFEVSRSFTRFYHLLAEEKVTVLSQTPTAFKQLMITEEENGVMELSLRYVVFGGEALNLNSLKNWYRNHEETKPLLVNMYGITETTVHVTYRPIYLKDTETGRSLTGKPIPDLKVYLLDENQVKTAAGEVGEICVSGAGLARGYLRRPELTAERFIDNPYEAGERLYLSGDLGRYTEDGDLEYIGRKDKQVKIRGFRIELGEIESALASYEHVAQAAVISDEEEGEKILHAYIITDGTPVDKKKIRRFVREKLPVYMVPSKIDLVDSFPMTVNGKMDISLLKQTISEPENETEKQQSSLSLEEIKQKALAIFCHELHETDVSPEEDIFDLGATSLTIVTLSKKIHESLGLLIPIDVFLDMPVIKDLLEYLTQKQPEQKKVVSGLQAERDEETIIALEKGTIVKECVPGYAQAGGFKSEQISWKDFSLLFSRYRRKEVRNKGRFLYASAGGKNAVQVYIYVKEDAVENLAAGAYYYHPEEDAVYYLSEGLEINKSIYPAVYQKVFEEAGFAVFFIAELKAIEPVYMDLSQSLVQVDCGYMEELMVSGREKLPLNYVITEGIDHRKIVNAFKLTESHLYLGAVLGGISDDRRLEYQGKEQYWLQFEQDFGSLTEEKAREINRRMEYKELSKYEVLELARKKIHLRKDIDAGTRIVLAAPEKEDWLYLRRASKRSYLDKIVQLTQIGSLLALLSCYEAPEKPAYQYASLGEKYLINTYVYVKKDGVEGIEEGIYLYQPESHSLKLVNKEIDVSIGNCHTPFNRPQYKESRFSIFFIIDLEEAKKEYGKGYLKYVLTEAGIMGQMLMDYQFCFDLGLVPIGGLRFEKIRHLFQLSERTMLLHSFVGGSFDYAEMEASSGSFHKESTARRSSEEREPNSIAVIGMSGRYPGADSPEEYWDNLERNSCEITPLPEDRKALWQQWDMQKLERQRFYAGWIRSIDQFDCQFFHISPLEARRLDPQERIMLEVVWECMERAGYTVKSIREKKLQVGVFVGTMWGDYEKYGIDKWEEGKEIEEVSLHSSIANRISYFFDFHGPSISVQTACSSAMTAFHMACNSLENKECDMAIVGGVNLISHPFHLEALKSQGILTDDGTVRIYSDATSGMAAGEGVGVVLLKRMENVLNENDLVLATVVGTEIADYGRTKRFGMVSIEEQEKLYRSLLEKCRLKPTDIEYIEVAATGLAVSDFAEVQALSSVFSEIKEKSCLISSLKGNIGHLEAASFMAQLHKVILEMQNRRLVPGLFEPTAEETRFQESPFKLAAEKNINRSSDTKIAYAMINSFGAYGSVGSAVVKAPAYHQEGDTDQLSVCMLSAGTWEQLDDHILRLMSWLSKRKEISVRDIAYTLGRREHDFCCKVAFIVSTTGQFLDLLNQLKKQALTKSCIMDDKGLYTEADHLTGELHKAAWEWIDRQDDHLILNKIGVGFVIELPTCTFQKQSCWISGQPAKREPIKQEAKDHEEKMLRYVVKTYSEVSEIDEKDLDPEQDLEAYGLTSLMIVAFNKRLRDDIGIVSPTLLFEVHTLRELAEMLSDMRSGQGIGPVESETGWTVDADERELAVVGLSGIYPGAADVDELWENLLNGVDSISEIDKERWDNSQYFEPGAKGKAYVNKGGFITEMSQFDPLFFHISPREAELMDPQERKFLEVAYHTMEDAGYTAKLFNQQTGHAVGVFVGNMFSDYLLCSGRSVEESGYISTGTVSASISNRVSYIMNFHGPSMTVNTMCSSALTSLQLAVESIRNGTCRAALVGGVNLIVHPNKYIMHCQNHMLSKEGKCATFGEGGDGFVPAEGVGAILIRPLKDAIAAKDHIYGVIRGVGINHDGKTNGYMIPNPTAQSELVQRVLKESHVEPETIQYVEAHGTGTRLGDPIEIRGLANAYAKHTDRKQFSAIGSIKANIGHCEGAAGIASITKILLQMKYRKFVPNLHCRKLNPEIDFTDSPFYLPQEVMEWKADGLRRASVSSFGSGGSNGYAILEEYQQQYQKKALEGKEMILAFSAASLAELSRIVENTRLFLEKRNSAYIYQNKETELAEMIANIAGLDYRKLNKKETFMELGFGDRELKEMSRKIQEKWNYSVENGDILMNRTIQEVIKEWDFFEECSTEYSLENIAFTLFNGREIKKEKVVFVCTGMSQLLTQMCSYGKGLKGDGIFDNASGLLAYKQGGIFDVGASWFTGKLDVQGVDHCFPNAMRVSLPGYPFEGQRYWVKTEKYDFCTDDMEQCETIWKEVEDNPHPEVGEAFKGAIYEILANVLKIDKKDLVMDEELSNYGMDSIGLMDFCDTINRTFGALCSISRLLNCVSCRELVTQTEKMISEKHGSTNTEKQIQKERRLVRKQKTIEIVENREIAIIGMAGMAPGSASVEDYWNILFHNENRIMPCPEERKELREYFSQNPEKENIFYGGYLDHIGDWDPFSYRISPSEAIAMDPQQRLFLDVALDALNDANYSVDEITGSRLGVFVGTGSEEYGTLMRKYNVSGAHSVLGESRAIIANRLSYFLNVHGPSETVDTACSSAMVAINRAVKAIRNDECEMAMVGGLHLMLTPEKFVGYHEAGMLTNQKSVHVFSEESDGFLRSEGVGCLVLKDLQAAKTDGDRIYAVIKGSAVNHNGKTMSITTPDMTAQKNVALAACKDAGIEPTAVQYVEAQGAATRHGDMIEWEALTEVYGKNEQKFMGISAIKPNFGHMESAYGMFALIKVLYAMKHHVIPAIIGCNQINKLVVKSEYIIRTNKEWNPAASVEGVATPRVAAIHSYGVGGVNAHIIVEEYQAGDSGTTEHDIHEDIIVFLLSASTSQDLVDYVKVLSGYVECMSEHCLADLAYTLHKNDMRESFRVAFSVSGKAELMEQLKKYIVEGEYLWIHDTSKMRDTISQMLDAEAVNLLIENAIKTQNYDTVIKLWESGMDIAWQALYGGKKRERLSVPVQKRIRKEYWVSERLNERQAGDAMLSEPSGVAEQVIDMIRTIIDCSEESIRSESPLIQYGFDSIMIQRLKLRVEDEYGIRIAGNELQYQMSVSQIERLIIDKLAETQSILNNCSEVELLSIFDELSQ